jgi:hypothetical protein
MCRKTDEDSCVHLEFNDQATLEEIRKINPAYGNAISRDVADRGQALAERIDQADGSLTASDSAKPKHNCLSIKLQEGRGQAHKGVVRRATGRTLTEQAHRSAHLGRPIRLLAVTRNHRL